MYLCICNCLAPGMSPMSAMSAAGLAATSAATNSYPVSIIKLSFFPIFINYFWHFFSQPITFPNIQIIMQQILGLVLSPRLRDAQLGHRSHDLVHHEHGLRPHARCVFVFAFVLFLFGFSAFIYLCCFRSMLGRDHVTKFHSIYFFSSFLETCPQMKQFLRRSQVRRKETEENALVI